MSKTQNRRKLAAKPRKPVVRKRKGPVVVTEFVDPCTCPSGNRSLRWPCPVHPPTKPRDYAEGPTGLNGGKLPAWITTQLERWEAQHIGPEKKFGEVVGEWFIENQTWFYMAAFILLVVVVGVKLA